MRLLPVHGWPTEGCPSSGLGRGLGHLPPRGKAIETAEAAPVRTLTFLYLIGSVFAPMIAVQIADHFILHRDRFAVAADARNLVIWLVGFIAYRLLMGVDTPVGYTLPDMVLTVVLCLLAEKVKPTKQM